MFPELISLPSKKRDFLRIKKSENQVRILLSLRCKVGEKKLRCPKKERAIYSQDLLFPDAATLVDVNIFVRSFSSIDDVKMVSAPKKHYKKKP